MQDQNAALEQLTSGQTLDDAETESYAEIALTTWLLSARSKPPKQQESLERLAQTLVKNQKDYWLVDFLQSQQSTRADTLLGSAIAANYRGDADRALRDSHAASLRYQQVKNLAGTARSELESIYALRRQSRAKDCENELALLTRRIGGRRYYALEIEAAYEQSACEGMLLHIDGALLSSRAALDQAESFGYPSAALRALALEAALDNAQGSPSQGWLLDQRGLDIFWSGSYQPERAFQFYSDLQEDATRKESWPLAAAYQLEAIRMLDETGRMGLQAIAYFQLGLLDLKNDDQEGARLAFAKSESRYAGLPQNAATDFYRAYAEIELSRLEAVRGNPVDAADRLTRIGRHIRQVDNFLVLVPYYGALAEVDRQMGRRDDEISHLEQAIRISQKGLPTVHSEQQRWELFKETDRAYHRLIELEQEGGQSDFRVLGSWEAYRTLQSNLFHPLSQAIDDVKLASFTDQLKRLKDATLVSFVVFPDSTDVWIADDRGISRVRIQVARDVLRREVARFVALCASRGTPIEKVNAAGARLYQQLLAPIQSSLQPGRRLLIEGDDMLNRMPWAALSISDQEYFGDRYVIVNTPGLLYRAPGDSESLRFDATLLVYPGATEFGGHRFDPLPNAKDEIDYLSAVLPHPVKLEERNATVGSLIASLKKASIFHFAGHAEPRRAGGELLLHDGTISASMMQKLTLSKHPLVVLSACSTGIAGGDPSRDPNGLVRTFLAAGARDVIATRWDVDSRASFTFSKSFYPALLRTGDPATAASEARRTIRSNPQTMHPFYWSPFDVFGMSR